MESNKVKLYYFNLNGLGALPRLLLNYGNVNFEDQRISFEEWPKVKETLDFKFLPCLEIDGVQYSESLAINVLLAKKLGNLMGKTPEDEHAIIATLATWSDFGPKVVTRAFGKGDQEENTNALLAGLSKVAPGLESLYTRNGSGKYLLGDSLSLADFYLAYVFGHVLFNNKNFSDATETFKKHAPKLSSAVEGIVKSDTFSKLLEKTLIKDSLL